MEVKFFIIGAGVLALLAAICFACAAMFLVKAGKEALGLLAQVMRASEPAVVEQVPAAAEAATTPAESEPPQPAAKECSGCGACKPASSEPEEKYEMVDGFFVRSNDFETRADGVRVRKDRWEVGMRNIAGILTGPRAGFEIEDIVEKVRAIAKEARADYESGGKGIPGSAPVWGPCPAKCDRGSVRANGEWADCPTCDGQGEVVVEPARVLLEVSQ
jgi:hypothetical protein